MTQSTGPELLKKALDDRQMTQGQLRRRIGAPTGAISRWIRGERRPGLNMAVRLERELGIPVDAWSAAPSDLGEPLDAPGAAAADDGAPTGEAA
jgi:plasmid maintenance system antidote protein VapI